LDRGPVRYSGLAEEAAPAPHPRGPEEGGLLELQQTAGNAAVASLLEPGQPTPGDPGFSGGRAPEGPEGLDTRTEEGLFKTVHEFVHIGDQRWPPGAVHPAG
jgi:hypothetical protein